MNQAKSLFDEDEKPQQSQHLQQDRWKLSLMALFYKNLTLYKKNYCSNICQILTPLLCISFTIVARLAAQQFTTGQVASFNYPQPFHLPYFPKYIPNLHINCTERYYYSIVKGSNTTTQNAQRLLGRVLKTYCDESAALEPQFLKSQSPDQTIMKILNQADHEQLQRGVDLKINIPDGLIQIKKFQQNILQSQLSINDWRLPEYHKNNGVTKMNIHNDQMITTYLRVTQGLMSLIQKITRSYLQQSHKQQIISGYFMYMPFNGEDKSLINKVSNVLGSGLYPLGLSLLFPLFLFNIVSEKQEKLIQIMKMNGMLMKYYWVCFFTFNFILSLLSCAMLFFLGKFVFAIQFFSHTGWTINWTLFIGWSISQVSLTTFIQIFINNSKTATIIGYLLSIFSALLGQTISTVIYPFPMTLPLALLFFPPFALCRGMYLIGFACANNSACYQNILQLDAEMYVVFVCLYCWLFVFIGSTYLHGMIQQQFGTSRLPAWIACLFKRQQKIDQIHNETVYGTLASASVQMQEIDNEQGQLAANGEIIKRSDDDKVDQSVLRVIELTNKLRNDQLPLIIKKLSKNYGSGDKIHHALKPNTFALDQKQIFGLLGPNGAGKTTLISVLTGLYGASQGQAWINGKEVGSQQANLHLGVCPQFDLLWENMTISEHMIFFGLLKGVSLRLLDDKITKLLKDVDLLTERDLKTCQLSGGMRRRLSLAIALMGDPRVVILDEPSSGLDPSHRRQMWNILLKCKKRTTILLTTHLMQQAEALCDRIGIIDKGILRCIGTQSQLKQKFGQGYRLTVNFKQKMEDRAAVMTYFQDFGCEIVSDLGNRVMVKLAKQKMLQCVRKLRSWPSLSWLLSQPSLYDVFMHFIG